VPVKVEETEPQIAARPRWTDSAEQGFWPLDLMFVSYSTFTKMWAAAVPIKLVGAPVKIPSLDHLLALKLHALRNSNQRRELKDMVDSVYLIEANRIDV